MQKSSLEMAKRFPWPTRSVISVLPGFNHYCDEGILCAVRPLVRAISSINLGTKDHVSAKFIHEEQGDYQSIIYGETRRDNNHRGSGQGFLR